MTRAQFAAADRLAEPGAVEQGLAALPADAAHPPLRGRGPVAVPARRGARHDAPVLGPGGGARSACAARSGREDRVAGTYRGHGHALALGVEPQALLDELLGRATGVCGGRAGSMNVDRPRAPADRLLRDRRRLASPRRPAPRSRSSATRRRRGRLLRRRRDQPGLLPRVPELRRRSSGCRSSSSARTTATASSRRARTSPPGRSPTARAALGMPAETDRRQRRLGGPRDRRARRSSAPAPATGPPFVECADLPLRRPLAQRPGQVPQAGRARRVDASATRCSSRARGWSSATASTTDALDAIDAEVDARARADRRARARRARSRTRGAGRGVQG